MQIPISRGMHISSDIYRLIFCYLNFGSDIILFFLDAAYATISMGTAKGVHTYHFMLPEMQDDKINSRRSKLNPVPIKTIGDMF